mgnify:FL=1
MSQKKMLTTGAFARLCKTTKETLFHYDREGILKPRYISANGYRYYGVNQYWDFNIITTLKDIGCSLQEIRQYFQDCDHESARSFLEEKRLSLEEKIARLIHRKQLLDDMTLCLHEISTTPHDTVVFSKERRRILELYPIETSARNTDLSFITAFYNYMECYRGKMGNVGCPVGVIIGKPGDEDNGQEDPSQYVERYFFASSRIGDPTDGLPTVRELSERLFGGRDNQGETLPGTIVRAFQEEGTYAHLIHKSSYFQDNASLQYFLSELRTRGLAHEDWIYICDMLSYSREESQSSYVYKFSVRLLEDHP